MGMGAWEGGGGETSDPSLPSIEISEEASLPLMARLAFI